MNAQGSAAALGQDLEVPAGLRSFDHSERVLLPRNRQVGGIIAGDLQKHTAVWAALVGLSGGMQESWAEADAGRVVPLIAQQVTQLLQSRDMVRVHLDVGEQGEVVIASQPIQMRTKIASKRFVAPTSFRQRISILIVREQFDPGLLEEGLFFGKRSSLFVFGSQIARSNFAGFDIGLIEGIDSDN